MCDKDKKLIENIVFEMAQDFSYRKGNDNMVIMNGTIYGFESLEQLHEFRDEVNKHFESESFGKILIYDEERLVARVGNVSKLVKVLKDNDRFDRNVKTKSSVVITSVNVTSPTYVVPDSKKTEYIKQFKKKQFAIREKARKELNVVTSLLRHPNNDSEYNELLKRQRSLQQILFAANDITRNMGYDFEQTIDGAQTIITRLNNIAYNIEQNNMDNDSIEIARDLFYSAKEFFRLFGSEQTGAQYKSVGTVSLSEENQIVIDDLNHSFNNIMKRFESAIEKSDILLIQTSPILLAKKNKVIEFEGQMYSIFDIIQDPNTPIFKRMFGGAKISDIKKSEKLGLNVDMSSTFDGVIGQLEMQDFKIKAQKWNNLSESEKKRLISVSKRLIAQGINLDKASTCSMFREKDKYGDDTGYLVHLFTPEFRKKLNDFHSLKRLNDNDAKKKIKEIHDEFEVINIFRLPFFHKELSELDKHSIEYQMKEKMMNEFPTDYFSLLDEFESDEEYDKELKERLGDVVYEEVVNNAINTIIQHINSVSGTDMANRKELNPWVVLKKALENERHPDSVFVGTSILDSSFKFKEDGKDFYYDFNKLTLIPKKDKSEYYNKTYIDNFIRDTDGLDDRVEGYKLISKMLYRANSLYRGKSDLMLINIQDSLQEDFGNLLSKTINWKNTDESFVKLLSKLWENAKSELYKDTYYTENTSSVAANHRDTTERDINRLIRVYNLLDDVGLDVIAKETDTDKSKYIDKHGKFVKDDFILAMARKKALSKHSGNLFTSVLKMHDLYAAQNAREEMYPVAQSLLRRYKKYYMNEGNDENASRKLAVERMTYWIQRSIQKINIKGTEKALDFKVDNVEFIKNVCSKYSELPILGKVFNSTFLKRLTDTDKEVFNLIREFNSNMKRDHDFKFKWNDIEYIYENGKAYKIEEGMRSEINKEDGQETDELDDALKEYFEYTLANTGTSMSLQNIIDVISQLLMMKCLSGVSSVGIFNRIEGMLAAQMVDATGRYWKPGDLAIAEREFFFSGMTRYVDKDGNQWANGKGMPMLERRFKNMRITSILAQRCSIFQDMKNQLDKTAEGVQKGVLTHNLDIWQFAVEIPEFKNQMSMAIAMMMDEEKVKIFDKDGNSHPLFDRDTGEFTCYDIVDNELVLKEEFDTERNRDIWINFSPTEEVIENIGGNELSKIVISDSEQLSLRISDAIRRVQGDYDKFSALNYVSSPLLALLMTFKRWYPAKILSDYSAAGDNGVYNLARDEMQENGAMYDMIVHTKALWMFAPAMSLTSLDSNMLKNIGGLALGGVALVQALKVRFGGTKNQTDKTIAGTMELLEFMKTTAKETLWWADRVIGKELVRRKLGKGEDTYGFTDDEWEEVYGKGCVQNMRLMARRMADLIMLNLIGFAAKCAFWDDEDGDDSDRKRTIYWVDNQLANLKRSTVDTMNLLNSFDDKFNTGDIALIRWITQIETCFKEYMEGDVENGNKYLMKSIPLPRMQFKFWEAEKEYDNTESTDLLFNFFINKDGYVEKRTRQLKKDFMSQYIRMWKKGKLPKEIEDKVSSGITDNIKKDYNNEDVSVYTLNESDFKKILENTDVIPKKSAKMYKDMSTKEFFDVMSNKYETDNYITRSFWRTFVSWTNEPIKNLWLEDIMGRTNNEK